MNSSPRPEQDYTLLLDKTVASGKNPFGKNAVKRVARPITTKTILRTITPDEATVIVQEVAKLLDRQHGQQYAEVTRRMYTAIQTSKKLRKRYNEDDIDATLNLIQVFTRFDQLFQMRKSGKGEGNSYE